MKDEKILLHVAQSHKNDVYGIKTMSEELNRIWVLFHDELLLAKFKGFEPQNPNMSPMGFVQYCHEPNELREELIDWCLTQIMVENPNLANYSADPSIAFKQGVTSKVNESLIPLHKLTEAFYKNWLYQGETERTHTRNLLSNYLTFDGKQIKPIDKFEEILLEANSTYLEGESVAVYRDLQKVVDQLQKVQSRVYDNLLETYVDEQGRPRLKFFRESAEGIEIVVGENGFAHKPELLA